MEECYFVDWDGNTRSVNKPGKGLHCGVIQRPTFTQVDVVRTDGEVIFEGVYYNSVDTLKQTGVQVKLLINT